MQYIYRRLFTAAKEARRSADQSPAEIPYPVFCEHRDVSVLNLPLNLVILEPRIEGIVQIKYLFLSIPRFKNIATA